jgi:hypothetical protein
MWEERMAAQLALYEPDRRTTPDTSHTPERRRPYAAHPHAGVARVGHTRDRRSGTVLCQACHGREARYGFRVQNDDPQLDRPRTLCFECFRLEVVRRQEAARAVQLQIPLEQRLDAIHKRRRRAQIAARKALGL